MSFVDELYEWRYLPRGTRRHAFIRVGEFLICVCGASEKDGDSCRWRGTGTQREYDKLARLSRCGNCMRKLGKVHSALSMTTFKELD